jgi:hypothetical protein
MTRRTLTLLAIVTALLVFSYQVGEALRRAGWETAAVIALGPWWPGIVVALLLAGGPHEASGDVRWTLVVPAIASLVFWCSLALLGKAALRGRRGS